jgi:hypothetical protein
LDHEFRNDAVEFEISASSITDEVLDGQRRLLWEQPDVVSPNIVWIVASLASGDGPARCDVTDVATVCSSYVGRGEDGVLLCLCLRACRGNNLVTCPVVGVVTCPVGM